MNVKAYPINESYKEFKISPSTQVRDCFQGSPALQNAYYCLPLRIGSELGWQISCPTNFCCNWDGSDGGSGLKIFFEDKKSIINKYIKSHFGGGILTFDIPYVIRSPKKKSLYIRGPTNFYKEYCQYLDAIIETDWLNFTFTYNIKINKKNTDIFFKKDEPICSFCFINLEEIANQNIQIKNIGTEPNLIGAFTVFAEERIQKNKKRQRSKSYYQGGFNLKDKKDDVIGCPFLHFKRLQLKCNNDFNLKNALSYLKIKIHYLLETWFNTILNYFYDRFLLKFIIKNKSKLWQTRVKAGELSPEVRDFVQSLQRKNEL